MANLDLNTVELTSTLRTAPQNGSPSSSDYNSSQRENLVDLASIVDFINNQLLPMLNALPDTALQPTLSPVGIEGRTIWTDTSDQSTIFFDSLSSQPLTIAGSLRVINGILTVASQQLIDLGVEVASLQSRLASTNQNDIALALQNLSASLNQLTITQQVQGTQINQIGSSRPLTMRSDPVTVPAGTIATTTFTFSTPFSDTLYTLSVAAEETSGTPGLVSVSGFIKNGGNGVTVALANNDSLDHSVIVHIIVIHD